MLVYIRYKKKLFILFLLIACSSEDNNKNKNKNYLKGLLYFKYSILI